jgi:hypothetical protein
VSRQRPRSRPIYEAEWCADFHACPETGGEYVLRRADGTNWYSPDGIMWTADTGKAVQTAELDAIRIYFAGGPREGQHGN